LGNKKSEEFAIPRSFRVQCLLASANHHLSPGAEWRRVAKAKIIVPKRKPTPCIAWVFTEHKTINGSAAAGESGLIAT
jgi:hypothetical protein